MTHSPPSARRPTAASPGESFTATLMMAHADGSSFWCELTGSAVDPRYPRESSIWIFTDVTERKLAEERAKFLSLPRRPDRPAEPVPACRTACSRRSPSRTGWAPRSR